MHILTLVCYYQSGKNTQVRNLSNELKIICEMLALKIVMDPLRLTANVKVTTFLGSVPAFSDTVESEGRQTKQF
jgi:hypothetical protein